MFVLNFCLEFQLAVSVEIYKINLPKVVSDNITFNRSSCILHDSVSCKIRDVLHWRFTYC